MIVARPKVGQRQRQHQQEGDRLAAEEAEAVDGEGRQATDQQCQAGCPNGCLDRGQQRVANLAVLPGRGEPAGGEAAYRPGLGARRVEGVEEDDRQRDVEKEQDQRGRDCQPDAGRERVGPAGRGAHSASSAPSRRAPNR